MAAVALTAMTAMPAMAQDQNSTFTVNGSVDAKCSAFTAGTFAINGGTIATDSSGMLTSANTGTSTPVAVWCNSAGAKINVSHTPLVNAAYTTDTAAFTKTINFVAKANVAGVEYAAGADRDLGVVSGDLTVTASNLTSGGLKPFAGAYQGTITVVLKPGA